MSLSHNSTLSKTEPDWGSINKTTLPRNSFADMGEVGKKSSYRYPHHHVESGKTGGENGIFVSGNMYLHRGGLKAALQAAGGARSGQKESNPSVKRHLSHHADVIGMERKETAALLGMSVGSLEDFLNNDINNSKRTGGEKTMGMTYEEIEAKLSASEDLVAEKESVIIAMGADATSLKAKITEMEEEIAKFSKSDNEMIDKIDELEKEAKGNLVYVEAGKKAIDDMKSEISKMSVQVDGNDYNEELLNKQLAAFGNDVTALSQFKNSLESRRAKLFKTGEIKADEKASEKTVDQKNYELGQKIGAGNVIPIK